MQKIKKAKIFISPLSFYTQFPYPRAIRLLISHVFYLNYSTHTYVSTFLFTSLILPCTLLENYAIEENAELSPC